VGNPSAATGGHEKVVEVLLNHGANIEAQEEKTKDTGLALACSGGHFKVVDLLLKRGANKENHNVKDYTPLTMAASEGHVDIIKLLLANGAEINSHTDSKRGLTPLMMAAQNGHVEAVRILSEMGSDINAFIKCDGYTALTLACYYDKTRDCSDIGLRQGARSVCRNAVEVDASPSGCEEQERQLCALASCI